VNTDHGPEHLSDLSDSGLFKIAKWTPTRAAEGA